MHSQLSVVLTVVLPLIAIVHGQGEFCYTPSQEAGTCVFLPQCPYLVQIYGYQPRNRDVINYLIASQTNCGRRSVNRNPIVCCGEPVTEAPAPTTTTTPRPTAPPPPPPPPTFPPPEQLRNNNNANYCLGPDGRDGTCLNIRSCPELLNELQQRGSNPEFAQFLRNSNGICLYQPQVVCCPLVAATPNVVPPSQPDAPAPVNGPVARLLTAEEGCGSAKNVKYTKVVGGVEANKGSMPWMTLIGYTDKLGDIGWKCGGSLITSRHILTAAHCIKSTLTTVRLGEHDLSNSADTAFDVNVVKVVKHPTYDAKDGHNDLAVLYLERDVQFTDYVRPICLPLADPIRSKNFVGYNPFVAGWGRTAEGGKPSNVLQQLQLPVLENAVCKAKYSQIGKLISEKQFDQAVLCAGVLDGGKDSCQGDSGGPLMQPVQRDGVPNFYQIGIVSYGIGCARADVPGVYTRVQTFVDWIGQRVAERT